MPKLAARTISFTYKDSYPLPTSCCRHHCTCAPTQPRRRRNSEPAFSSLRLPSVEDGELEISMHRVFSKAFKRLWRHDIDGKRRDATACEHPNQKAEETHRLVYHLKQSMRHCITAIKLMEEEIKRLRWELPPGMTVHCSFRITGELLNRET
ncbi:hypothetical protein BT69DRAFT_400592 [Atractiella rhizophila]|nr:hypothetical protein BT69DRAFT_400592 [Atractiella rhizophila]